MRLKNFEIDSIKSVVAALDPEARVYLFGSRVKDAEKGGDIDLLIFSSKLEKNDKARIKRSLFEKIGEQKIDFVITKDASDPFVNLVLKEAKML
ncbi:MAG: nucleotidyltransferase domain-containing protein [Chlamydiae bacterium]|nr:nucleotidyltransferase domain-containing protein [Chlamydiota bacterium]MBI3276936.1 nucleotidyltransferase domain-containing protein [Chlamydiota bacterium]